MPENERIFQAQAERQRRLRDLSWPEKVRMMEAARDAIVTLRNAKRMSETTGDTEDGRASRRTP